MELDHPRPLNPAMTFDEISMERSKSFVNALQVLDSLILSSAFLCVYMLILVSGCGILAPDPHLLLFFSFIIEFCGSNWLAVFAPLSLFCSSSNSGNAVVFRYIWVCSFFFFFNVSCGGCFVSESSFMLMFSFTDDAKSLSKCL